MLKIDTNLLVELGLGSLPEAERNSLLKHIYETLEMRVGMRLADQMSNEQLDEFEKYFEAKDDAGAFKWLEANFPNYKDIVQEEFEKLKAEVAQSAPGILQASQATAAQQPQAPAPQMVQPQEYQAQQPQAQQHEQPMQQPVYQQPQPQAQPLPTQPQPVYEQPMQQPAAIPQPVYQQPQPMPQQAYPDQQPPAGPQQ